MRNRKYVNMGNQEYYFHHFQSYLKIMCKWRLFLNIATGHFKNCEMTQMLHSPETCVRNKYDWT